MKRTLRRQAQEFIERPFVGRHAEIFEYSMTPAERQLYDDVTRYLLEPNLCAFRGSQRRLLLIGFHKRRDRLFDAGPRRQPGRGGGPARGQGNPKTCAPTWKMMSWILMRPTIARPLSPKPFALSWRGWSRMPPARSLPIDSKAQALLKAVGATDKLVIFTESLTARMLQDVLVNSGQVGQDEVTLFSRQ